MQTSWKEKEKWSEDIWPWQEGIKPFAVSCNLLHLSQLQLQLLVLEILAPPELRATFDASPSAVTQVRIRIRHSERRAFAIT